MLLYAHFSNCFHCYRSLASALFLFIQLPLNFSPRLAPGCIPIVNKAIKETASSSFSRKFVASRRICFGVVSAEWRTSCRRRVRLVVRDRFRISPGYAENVIQHLLGGRWVTNGRRMINKRDALAVYRVYWFRVLLFCHANWSDLRCQCCLARQSGVICSYQFFCTYK